MTLRSILRFAKVIVVVNMVDYPHANMACVGGAENMEARSSAIMFVIHRK